MMQIRKKRRNYLQEPEQMEKKDMNWKYYNHAMIPNIPPHINPDITPIEDRSIWRTRTPSVALFARWTTEFDCKTETEWWYCIKDTQFDISKVNSKKRYEINKGNKNFDVRLIRPTEYVEELYQITKAAYLSWPEKYRPSLNEEDFKRSIGKWNDKKVFGAFLKESNDLVGYAYIIEFETYADFSMLRVIPSYEKKAINAAIVNKILEYYNDRLGDDFYILDGARNVNHETFFQNYLEKYFEFRKAYCKLHIVYNPKVKWLVKVVYPFRRVLKKFDNINLVHQVNAVLKMEEIVRNS